MLGMPLTTFADGGLPRFVASNLGAYDELLDDVCPELLSVSMWSCFTRKGSDSVVHAREDLVKSVFAEELSVSDMIIANLDHSPLSADNLSVQGFVW